MLPKQKTTLAEKYKVVNPDIDDKYNWFHQTADHYISQFSNDNQITEIHKLQNAVEGIIDFKDYGYLLNPFNIDSGKQYKVGAKLRNHNILKGVVYLMTGEYARRTHDFVVTSLNPDDENKYKEGLRSAMKDFYEQETINQLNDAGVPTGQDSKEQGTPEEAEQKYKANYDTQRALFGQNAIDYIRYNQDVEDKIIEAYYDWISTGAAYTGRFIRSKDVEYEHIPVDEIYVPFETHSRFIEDASFVVRRSVLPLARIIDLFGDKLSEKDLERLEEDYNNDLGFFKTSRTLEMGARGFVRLPTIDASSEEYLSNRRTAEGYPVYHVQWRSFEKYGILTFLDEFGQEQTMEVDDTYKLDKELGDVKIEWHWDTCICEDIRINEDIHVYDRIVEESRGRLDSRGGKKLSYNGIRARSKSGSIQCPVKEGIPYQLLINGLHYQLEKVINKNKDKVMVIPYGLIPRKKGMDTKETMYHVDATSILWVDETAPNAALAAQMIKVLDMGLGTYIRDVYELISAIKQEYWDAIGMNAQRYSNIDQGAGKGTTEQAIVRSAIITYDLNRQMDRLLQKDYAGMLDLSKLAWIGGKKSSYILSDGDRAFLELNADDSLYHSETEYNVFVKDSTELTEGIQMMKSTIGAAAQQSGSLSAISEVVTNNNPNKLKNILGKIEDNNKKHEAYIAEINGKQQNELQDKINADKEADRQVKRYEADMQYQGVVDSANIRTQNNSRNEARPDSPVETMLANHQINKDISKDMKEERMLQQKDTELQLKNKQLEISKSKANGK